jgi:actin-related protein
MIWNNYRKHSFDQLKMSVKERPILLTEPPLNPYNYNRKTLVCIQEVKLQELFLIVEMEYVIAVLYSKDFQ